MSSFCWATCLTPTKAGDGYGTIDGLVHRSVLISDVLVSAGSEIERSVVLPDAVIGHNCRTSNAIVESDCRVPDGTSSVRLGAAGRRGTRRSRPS